MKWCRRVRALFIISIFILSIGLSIQFSTESILSIEQRWMERKKGKINYFKLWRLKSECECRASERNCLGFISSRINKRTLLSALRHNHNKSACSSAVKASKAGVRLTPSDLHGKWFSIAAPKRGYQIIPITTGSNKMRCVNLVSKKEEMKGKWKYWSFEGNPRLSCETGALRSGLWGFSFHLCSTISW